MEVGKVEFESRSIRTATGWQMPSAADVLAKKTDTRLYELEKAFAAALARIQALEGDLAAMQQRQDEMEAELEGVNETTRVMWQRGDYA